MQAYAPRDPLAEFLAGDLPLRKLRVMIEHLPPGNPVERELRGTPWSDGDWMLHDISSRLRDVLVQNRNLHRQPHTAATHPQYLPTPSREGVDDAPGGAGEQALTQSETELLATINRGGAQDGR